MAAQGWLVIDGKNAWINEDNIFISTEPTVREILEIFSKPVDIQKAFLEGPPKGYIWDFRSGTQTWLQTDSIRQGESRWYLADAQGDGSDDPAYFVEVDPTAASIVSAINNVAEKTWTDKSQLLDALLPAIRAIMLRETNPPA